MRPGRWSILLVLCLSVFVVNVSTTIVNIALPSLSAELGASTRDLLWIVDSFNLAFAALVLAAGSLSDRFGRRRALLVGLAVFLVAGLAGSRAGSPDTLIAWRVLAGVGAAVVYPVTLSILTNLFTDRAERAKAIGLWGATWDLGCARARSSAAPCWSVRLGLRSFSQGAGRRGRHPTQLAASADLPEPTSAHARPTGPGAVGPTNLTALVFTVIEAPDRAGARAAHSPDFTLALRLLYASSSSSAAPRSR